MNDELDRKLRDVLRSARPKPSAGWRERALTAMAAAQPERAAAKSRRLVTALIGMLVLAALAFMPYSASGPGAGMESALAAQGGMSTVGLSGEEPGGREEPQRRLPEHLRPYAGRAPQFVRERYADDPEMLMGAGLLAEDREVRLELLRSASEIGAGPAELAAYAVQVLATAPEYYRLAHWAVDPADAAAVGDARQKIEASGVPSVLQPGDVTEPLEALHRWQAADPENGFPVALEAYYLYGLHRDAEALQRWEEAAERPAATLRYQEAIWAVRRLLRELGMSEWEALTAAYSGESSGTLSALTTIRQCARIGVYEGRLAAMEGREADAVRWWRATIEFGRHMQESTDTLIEFLSGVAIEGVGARDVWWHERHRRSGLSEGPVAGGRLFQGRHHDLFVSQAGREASEAVRDSLLRAKVRAELVKEYVASLRGLPEGYMRWGALGALTRSYGVLLALLVLGYAAASIWRRKAADAATALGWRSGAAVALVALAPALAGSVTLLGAMWEVGLRPGLAQIGWMASGAWALSLLALLLAPLVAGIWSCRSGARLVAAWRGNLRRVLPAAMVVCALVSLGAGIWRWRTEAGWAEEWGAQTEVERVQEALGSAWTNPTILEDAWRAEKPPQVER